MAKLPESQLKFLQGQISYHDTPVNFCAVASIPPGIKTVYRSNNPFFGDSGSSLVQYYDNRGHTIGVFSIGYVDWNVPASYYSKVSHYIDWIKKTVDENE